MKGLRFSVWAASCISLGLLLAYADGVNMRGIIGSAGTMALVVAALIVANSVYRALKHKRTSKR